MIGFWINYGLLTTSSTRHHKLRLNTGIDVTSKSANVVAIPPLIVTQEEGITYSFNNELYLEWLGAVPLDCHMVQISPLP